MNVVYSSVKSKSPMTLEELTKAFHAFTSKTSKYFGKKYDIKRLEGNHCYCNGNGEFILLPLSDESVQSGQKRYMYCRKCGAYSHL